jgi:SAM-dependent methyltransferase
VNAVADFYDALAPEYDLMTGFEQRVVTDRPFFRLIVERYGIKRAVDAGCGTGFHSFLLAQLGVDVTAVDISSAMLRKLSERAAALNVQIRTVRTDFRSLAADVPGTYDAVFCLGNTLAHLPSDEELRTALTNFSSLLIPGGIVVLQIVNFESILTSQQRVQSVRERGDKIFVRFYDFEPTNIRFNILTLERHEGSLMHRLQSVYLRPIRPSELRTVVQCCGLEEPALYGGISLEAFDPERSPDVVLIARKAGKVSDISTTA